MVTTTNYTQASSPGTLHRRESATGLTRGMAVVNLQGLPQTDQKHGIHTPYEHWQL